jgi:hypothetical protein
MNKTRRDITAKKFNTWKLFFSSKFYKMRFQETKTCNLSFVNKKKRENKKATIKQ